MVGTDNDRLLAILHVVLNLQDTVDPQPVARSPLKTQEQNAGSVLFGLSDCEARELFVRTMATAFIC